MARILKPNPENLDKLAAVLAAGDLAAVPTETVYGLAGNALNPEAIRKIYAVKGRPAGNPLIVHIGDKSQLAAIARDIPEAAEKLMHAWWPGPLTLILNKTAAVPDAVTAGRDTVAVRMPAHPVFRDLASRCPFPLAAPSANPFGYVSPTRASHVEEQMGDRIDWILDGGSCDRGIESTILSLTDPGKPVLMRFGSISPGQLEETLGIKIGKRRLRENDAGKSLPAPGLMKRHYSPRTPVTLFEKVAPETRSGSAVVFLRRNLCSSANHFALSESGDLSEVARNLYDTLQALDRGSFERIYLELPGNTEPGEAIRDRMIRAAAD